MLCSCGGVIDINELTGGHHKMHCRLCGAQEVFQRYAPRNTTAAMAVDHTHNTNPGRWPELRPLFGQMWENGTDVRIDRPSV